MKKLVPIEFTNSQSPLLVPKGGFYLTSKKFPFQVSFRCMFFFFKKKKRFTDLFLYLHFYTDSS